MDLTGGTRATAVAAAGLTLLGLTLIVHGIRRDHLPYSLGGVAVTMIALTVVILAVIHRWITDTTTERTILAASQREAQAERARYYGAQAALTNEMGRLTRDMAAEKAGLTARLAVERMTMHKEFEERRATLIAETMEATFRMVLNGKLAPDQPSGGTLIPFPFQPEQQQAQQDRARGHGVVAP